MNQLEGFVQEGKEHLVCKLKKALYMLKQSLRAYYHCIKSLFINEGFCKSHVDHLLYVKQTCEYLLVAIWYMEDLIILANNVTK